MYLEHISLEAAQLNLLKGCFPAVGAAPALFLPLPLDGAVTAVDLFAVLTLHGRNG